MSRRTVVGAPLFAMLVLTLVLASGRAPRGAAQTPSPRVINSCAIVPDTSCLGADLADAVLAGALLVSADLTSANLTGANLVGALLVTADLTDVDLTGARFGHTICPDGTNSDGHGGTCDGRFRKLPIEAELQTAQPDV